MKRLFPLILILLLLCGCGGKTEYTEPTETVPLAQPTEPPGSYDPDSTLEMFTGGAVRAYPQNIPDIFAIACAGEDLLVFSGKGNTTLTRLTGENLFRIAEIQLDCMVDPKEPAMLITEDRLVYFDRRTGEMVFLDENFREFNRERLSEDWTGDPVITADRSKIYYCCEQGIRELDTETNISRLIKEMHYPMRTLEGLLLQDTVLQCHIMDGDQEKKLFVSTENGALLGQTDGDMNISGGENCFYGRYREGQNEVFLVGESQDTARMLTLEAKSFDAELLEASNGLLALSTGDESGMLAFFDFASGRKTAEVKLPASVDPYRFTEEPQNSYIYFLTHGEAESINICRWDVQQSPVADETIYTGPWYTLDNPDLVGLLTCEAYAQELSEKYGVQIHIWEAAVDVEPWDYDLHPEYRVPEIRDSLNKLDTMLRYFPTGFFNLAMEGMEGGKLHISLVQSMNGSHASGSLEEANGIQYWLGGDAYVAVALGDAFEKTLYHEMFHVLESRVLSKSSAYYRWDELNPRGFTYDNDYVANLEREESEWTTDDRNRAFIDTYSMSYPKEDRARVMEYACTEENENFFLSAVMQKKLRTLCIGIREAYGLENSPEVFLWEQYLESPLADKE